MSLKFSLLVELVVVAAFCFCDTMRTQPYNHKTNQLGILTWNTTIVNTFASNHAIPLVIHYPSVAAKDGYPVMVFYHGWECLNTWYDFIWQTFVPQGYIVVLPNDYTQSNETNELQCAQTQRFILDWLYSNCNQNSSCPLYSQIGNRSLASGHSQGGGSTLLSISNFSNNNILGQAFTHEFDAAFILSGCGPNALMINASQSIIAKPVFLMTASHDCMCRPTDTAINYYEHIPVRLHTCKFMADIYNGTHCGFMDAPPVHETACNVFDYLSCPFHSHENIQLQQQIQLVVQYMQLFMEATLIYNDSQSDFARIASQLQQDLVTGSMSAVESHCY